MTAQAGFRGTGMYPVNPMAIHLDVYETSLTTERPLEPVEQPLERAERPLQPAEQPLEPAERPVESEGRAELTEQLPNIPNWIGIQK